MRTPQLLTLLALTLVTVAADPPRGRSLEAAPPKAVEHPAPIHSRRLALVIGNDAYASAPRLAQARTDAHKFAAGLHATGFAPANVYVAIDTDLATLKKKIEQFITQLQPGDVAFVFYSGHAIEVRGQNYLLPVDYPSDAPEATVDHHAYSAQRLLELLDQSQARVRVLILDACRNNPFRGTRGAAGGLAPMEPGDGSAVIFSTKAGQTAADNGLFTTQFVATMRRHQGPFDGLVKDVARRVNRATNGRQSPVWYGMFQEDFYLNGKPNDDAGRIADNKPGPASDKPTCADAAKLLSEGRTAEAEVLLNDLAPTGCRAATRIAAFLERSNVQQARKWYEAAAQNGDVEAHRWLGEKSLEANQLPQARHHYVAAADKGDPASLAVAGMLCLRGQGGPVDYPRAHRYLQSAGHQQDPRGLFWLGVAHSRGLGVPLDPEGARAYLSRSASLGYKPAEELLGELDLQARSRPRRRAPEVIY
jgi:hypothetical protein